MLEDWQHAGFGLYLHWPFCEAKCPYCDFNSHVSASIDHDAWRRAYLDALTKAADETRGRALNTVFFGGGTPSLMQPDVVSDILDHVASLWPVSNNLEVTLEANPSSVEVDKFAAFRNAGINRVSLGVQALKDSDLKRLGRLHTVSEALKALDIADATFDRVSFDLMYGRQNQSLDAWVSELEQALTLGFSHMSLYHLTIEPETAFGARYRAGRLKGLPTDDTSADMYEVTQELCGAAGRPAYEVSNHAVPGEESRHNLIYWHYGDYLGIGPGAHGRVTLAGKRYATEHVRSPRAWLAGDNRETRTALDDEEKAHEFLVMGLRLHEGLDLSRLETLTNRQINQVALADLADDGWIETQERRLCVTDKGMPLLNAIIAKLSDALVSV